jgi:hygromycin-B 4-O-kinase
MSTAKTKVTPQLIQAFAKKHGYADATFEPIEDGELSQAYFFSTANGDKVLRINSTDEGFLKDKYAAEHFTGGHVPIPKIEAVGQLTKDRYFAVSERAPGKTLDKLGKGEVNSLMPEIIVSLEAIHATSPIGEGYGWWRLDGSGKSSSWHAALDAMQQGEDDSPLASITYFDHKQYESLRAEILDYYQYCPDIRQLVHGDYGFNNSLSDGATITGIIDWHGSMYGDPLYDVAWLDFWNYRQGYAAAFKLHYEDRGRLPANFDERLICYKLIIGANSLAFFAKSGQPEKYDFAQKIIAGIRN